MLTLATRYHRICFIAALVAGAALVATAIVVLPTVMAPGPAHHRASQHSSTTAHSSAVVLDRWAGSGSGVGLVNAGTVHVSVNNGRACFWIEFTGERAGLGPWMLVFPPGYTGSVAPGVVRNSSGEIVVVAGQGMPEFGGIAPTAKLSCAGTMMDAAFVEDIDPVSPWLASLPAQP